MALDMKCSYSFPTYLSQREGINGGHYFSTTQRKNI